MDRTAVKGDICLRTGN